MCLFSARSLLPEMALSVDSSWHRWQWRIRDVLFQSPSEATPLLSPEKERQSYNLTRQRIVFPNNDIFHQDWAEVSKRYSGNRICTTKYTLLTFLPQNLMEQFHRYTWSSNTHLKHKPATQRTSVMHTRGHLSFKIQMHVHWKSYHSFIQ